MLSDRHVIYSLTPLNRENRVHLRKTKELQQRISQA